MKIWPTNRWGRDLATLGLVAVALAGCRTEERRTAVAQVPADQPAPSSTVGSDGAADVTTRRVWPSHDVGFYASSISPDGRYLSMIDWSTANLAVRDLKTGELHPLTDVRNGDGKPFEHAEVSVFSPDGRELVVGWHYGSDLQVRVVGFETDETGVPDVVGGEVIFHNPEFYPYWLFDWSPDESRVLAKMYPRPGSSGSNQLALISTSDGTSRALKTFDWREPLRAEFSPDGRFIAYDFLPDDDSPNREIFVVSVDGTYETRIAPDPAFDRLLGWHPDGSILFHSDRGGTPGVWRVRMEEGRPTADPELVKADMWSVEPLGFAGDRFFYGMEVDDPRLYTAAVDLKSGRLTSAPVAVGAPARLGITGWEWSPDGRSFAYSATTPGARGSLIGIRSAPGEDVQTIRLEVGAASRIRWDRDGRSLVVFARDAQGRRGFHRIDLENGSSSTILRTDGLEEPTWRPNFELSPDGGTLYFARAREFGLPGTLVAYDIANSTVRVVLPDATEIYGNVAMSPDGARLAFMAPDSPESGHTLGTISVSGGPVARAAELPPELTSIWGLEWTPDGGSILVVASERVDLQRQLWLVPAEGGEPRRIELTDPDGVQPFLTMRGTSPLRLHPEGREIAFMAGRSRGEVWVMEGLRSTSPTAADAGGTR